MQSCRSIHKKTAVIWDLPLAKIPILFSTTHTPVKSIMDPRTSSSNLIAYIKKSMPNGFRSIQKNKKQNKTTDGKRNWMVIYWMMQLHRHPSQAFAHSLAPYTI